MVCSLHGKVQRIFGKEGLLFRRCSLAAHFIRQFGLSPFDAAFDFDIRVRQDRDELCPGHTELLFQGQLCFGAVSGQSRDLLMEPVSIRHLGQLDAAAQA